MSNTPPKILKFYLLFFELCFKFSVICVRPFWLKMKNYNFNLQNQEMKNRARENRGYFKIQMQYALNAWLFKICDKIRDNDP